MPLKHEKFVAKVREQNAKLLEDGETIDNATWGQTGPIYYGPVMNMIQAGQRMAGKVQNRLVVLTDRSLYVANPGMFGQYEMKQVTAKLPRAEAASHLRPAGRTQLELDGEKVYFRPGPWNQVVAILKALGGDTGET